MFQGSVTRGTNLLFTNAGIVKLVHPISLDAGPHPLNLKSRPVAFPTVPTFTKLIKVHTYIDNLN